MASSLKKVSSEGQRAEARFFLAQTLWKTRRDHIRARELATQARENWSHQGRQSDAEQASRWLAEHSP